MPAKAAGHDAKAAKAAKAAVTQLIPSPATQQNYPAKCIIKMCKMPLRCAACHMQINPDEPASTTC
jgi:ferredoxin